MTRFTPVEVNYILRVIAGEKAEKFQSEILYPQLARAMRMTSALPQDVRDALAEPYYAFRAMLGYYAFAKRGNDRLEYSGYALQALENVLGGNKKEGFAQFLAIPDAPQRLWESFVEVCNTNQRKVNEQLNRGIFEGLTGFAQRVYEEDQIGNIWTTIHQAIVRSGCVEPIYQQIIEIKGIGPKVGSLLLRDMVALYELEPHIETIDYHYLQPIDSWMRRLGPVLTSELENSSADWIIAGKLAKTCRRNQVSGVRFNQGVQYLAIVEVRHIEQIIEYLQRTVSKSVRMSAAPALRR